MSLVGSIFRGRVEELRLRVFLWPVLLCFFHLVASDWARAGNIKYIYFTLVRNSCALFLSGYSKTFSYSHTGVVICMKDLFKNLSMLHYLPKMSWLCDEYACECLSSEWDCCHTPIPLLSWAESHAVPMWRGHH